MPPMSSACSWPGTSGPFIWYWVFLNWYQLDMNPARPQLGVFFYLRNGLLGFSDLGASLIGTFVTLDIWHFVDVCLMCLIFVALFICHWTFVTLDIWHLKFVCDIVDMWHLACLTFDTFDISWYFLHFWHFIFYIFDIWHLTFDDSDILTFLTFDIFDIVWHLWHLTCFWHFTFAIWHVDSFWYCWHLAFGILPFWHLAFGIWHFTFWTFCIWHLICLTIFDMIDIWHLTFVTFDIWHFTVFLHFWHFWHLTCYMFDIWLRAQRKQNV